MPTYNNLPQPAEFFKGNLYNKLVEDLQLAGMAKRTVYGYVRAIRKLADRKRVVACDDTTVTVRFTPTGKKRSVTKTVTGNEFVRGFVQHTLPPAFRRFGITAG